MIIKRRAFIQAGSLATATLLVPKFLKAFEKKDFIKVPPGNKVVVVLQLSGGNDGLNTVIPVKNDIYYKSRPDISLQKNAILSLNDEVGLHGTLAGFKGLYDDGSLGILNGVGYPNPDRSHFRSMDIWQSASDSSEYWQTGWVGRYLDAQCNGCAKPTQALELDDFLSLALKGNKQKAIAFDNLNRLYQNSNEQFVKDMANAYSGNHDADHEQPVDYLYKTMSETVNSAGYIFDNSKAKATTAAYPNSVLGNNLKTIASLIYSEINTKVYYVSIGSFDTHVNQHEKQDALFKEMDEAVSAFVKDLKANHRFNDVLLFTFSEFGRRVAQNASHGTDHGTANNMFLIGGGLKQKGLINAMPDLNNLDEGDLKYQLDFKDVYATVLSKWLDVDDKAILGKQYQHLNFI